MTNQKKTAERWGAQGGQGNAENSLNSQYSVFVEQVTALVEQRDRLGGYPFASAMKLAEQHGINQDDATTAMRESRRFCLDVATRNLHLLRGTKL